MYIKPKNILVISSSHYFKEAIADTMAGRGYNTQFVHDLDSAVVAVKIDSPDLILFEYGYDFRGDDEMLRFYTYGGSAIHGKRMLIFTDSNRPTYSILGKSVEILKTSAIYNREMLRARISGIFY